MNRTLGCFSMLLLALGAASPRVAADPAGKPRYIGTAQMDAEGKIVLHLRASGGGGMVGHSIMTYAPNHPQYGEILDHVGSLEPGETKPVRPWPDVRENER